MQDSVKSLKLKPFFLTEVDDRATVASSVRLPPTTATSVMRRAPDALPRELASAVTGSGTSGMGTQHSPSREGARRAGGGDAIIEEQRQARLANQRLELLDHAINALHSLPGGDAGLSSRARDAASVVTSGSPSRCSSGRGGASHAATSRPASSSASMRTGLTHGTSLSTGSLQRRLTAGDIAEVSARARHDLLSQAHAAQGWGEEGDRALLTGGNEDDSTALQRAMAPKEDIERLLSELISGGAMDVLPLVLEPRQARFKWRPQGVLSPLADGSETDESND